MAHPVPFAKINTNDGDVYLQTDRVYFGRNELYRFWSSRGTMDSLLPGKVRTGNVNGRGFNKNAYPKNGGHGMYFAIKKKICSLHCINPNENNEHPEFRKISLKLFTEQYLKR